MQLRNHFQRIDLIYLVLSCQNGTYYFVVFFCVYRREKQCIVVNYSLFCLLYCLLVLKVYWILLRNMFICLGSFGIAPENYPLISFLKNNLWSKKSVENKQIISTIFLEYTSHINSTTITTKKRLLLT